MRNFHGGEKKRIPCEQAGGGRGRGRGRGRGPGKWTAASPSADFLASLRPVPNQAPGSQGSRPPPIILGPVAPPPVPMTLGNPLNPPALSFNEPTPAGCLQFCMQSFACTVRANEEGHDVVQAQVLPGRRRRRTPPPWAASRWRVSPPRLPLLPPATRTPRSSCESASWQVGFGSPCGISADLHGDV